MRFGNDAGLFRGSDVKGLVGGRPFGIVSVTEFGARGDGSTDDTAAIQAAIDAAGEGGVVAVPPGTYGVSSLTLSTGRRLIVDSATLKRLSYNPAVRPVVKCEDDAIIEGVLTIDGNADNVTVGDEDVQYAVQVLGDRVRVGTLRISGFTSGVAHLVNVDGDECAIDDLRGEGSSYSTLRLICSGRGVARKYFMCSRFVSIDAAHKGFVYNGTDGINAIMFDSFYADTSTEEDASDCFLIDSGDPDPAETDTTVVERVGVVYVGNFWGKGSRSNIIKIQHSRAVYLRNVYCENAGLYADGAAIRAWAPYFVIENIETDNRILAYGSIDVRNLTYLGTGDRVVEAYGTLGSEVRIDGLFTKDSGLTNVPIRVSSYGEKHVYVDRYDDTRYNPVSLRTPSPTNDVVLTLGSNNRYTGSPTASTADDRKVQRQPRTFIGDGLPGAGEATWVAGDILINSNNAKGRPHAWRCVTGGDPGTWEVIGQQGLRGTGSAPDFAGQLGHIVAGGLNFLYFAHGDSGPLDWQPVGSVVRTQAATADTTLSETSHTVHVDTSVGPVAITLPAVADYPGREFTIVKLTADTNAVNVVPSGADTINGAASHPLTEQYQYITLRAMAGTGEWVVIAEKPTQPEEAHGTATVPNGSTNVVVAHGLSEAPDLADISVTPTSDLGDATTFWISSPTATEFTINVDIDPGSAGASFAWQVRL